ncbi:hypothetical protein [Rummeliibacillus pycnus]|uniref:hypothetical protein n=1 Tax=Rummeliibacillus pycnus TaxID=101070 RepID=UPI0037CA00E0
MIGKVTNIINADKALLLYYQRSGGAIPKTFYQTILNCKQRMIRLFAVYFWVK